MTKERREEVVLIALVVSAAIHVALMFLVRAQVMTRSAPGLARPSQRGPMRVVNREKRPDPAKIEEILDLRAVKDAPPAAVAPHAEASGPDTMGTVKAPDAPEVRIAESVRPPEPTAKFEIRPVGLDARQQVVPVTRIETPKMSGASVSAPDFAVQVPTVAKTVAAPAAPAVAAPSAGASRL